ncbi:MAG TPA: FkbM family methyltransferase [Bacteroidales bacterium]
MMKDFIRKILRALHLDLTKNLQYDRSTVKIMKRIIKPASNCVDIGCHKGEMLDLMLKYAPAGKHFAFEPIPEMYEQLKLRYNGNCEVFQMALSDKKGETTFNYVKNAPAYSGIKKRKYAVKVPQIEELKVNVDLLDNVLPKDLKIDFIKIDVEGGEFGVLKGAVEILKKSKPVVVFEFGLGASEFYGTKPGELFDLLETCGLKISLLKSWLKEENPLDKEAFIEIYHENKEYYFIAHPWTEKFVIRCGVCT